MNSLSLEKRSRILGLLVEGRSIKFACSTVDVSKTTVLKLLAEVGDACGRYHDQHMTALTCQKIELKNLWAFSTRTDDVLHGVRHVHIWMAIDEETKFVLCWHMGTGSAASGEIFINDVIDRLVTHVQLTADGERTSLRAVEGARESSVDRSILIRKYGTEDLDRSPGPNVKFTNLTMRLNVESSFSRTPAFGRKLTNYMRALSMHFMHYNFCRMQEGVPGTPAMAAGFANCVWNLGELLKVVGD